MDRFFDCLNVKSPRQGILERKEYRRPYSNPNDHRFKVFSKSPAYIFMHTHPQSYIHTHSISHTPYTNILVLMITHTHCTQWLENEFMGYLREWQEELRMKFPSKKERNKRCLSRETLEGLQMTGMQLEL